MSGGWSAGTAPRPLASSPCARDEIDPGWLDGQGEPSFLGQPDPISRFMRLSARVLPWLAVAAGGTLGGAMLWGLLIMPTDHRLGETIRIMVVHVPAATLTVNVWLLMAVASALGLWRRSPLAHGAARAAAPVGAALALLALLTGAIWGRPTWGTWWVWDPRLTAMVVMLFFYLGYLALAEALDDPDASASLGAILCLVGVPFALLARHAVTVFAGSTMHDSASLVLRRGLNIDDALWWPVMVAMLGFHLMLAALTLTGMRTALLRRRAHALRLALAAARMA